MSGTSESHVQLGASSTTILQKMVRVTVGKMGFKKSDADECLLMRAEDQVTVILCVYINDMLVVGDKLAVEAFKKEITKFFNTKEEGM